MKTPHFNQSFFFFLLAIVGAMMFFILQPFLTAILAASILAALFQNSHQMLTRVFGGHRHIAAGATILTVAAIILVPVFIVLGLAVNEVSVAYDRLSSEQSAFPEAVTAFARNVSALPLANAFVNPGELDAQHLANILKTLSQNALSLAQSLYQSVTSFVLWLFATLFALFYFLLDGKRMVAYGMKVSPLRNEHEAILIGKFVSMSRATLRGTLLVSIVQGFLGGVAFAIAGIASPVVWGLLMTLLSVIPLVGAGIVWFPAGLILLVMGNVWQGVFVLVFGIAVISTIDNVLRPKLVGGDAQMHPLLVFFATLGGLSFFGFPGFVIGPIIASLALALVDIYALEFGAQLKAYNE